MTRLVAALLGAALLFAPAARADAAQEEEAEKFLGKKAPAFAFPLDGFRMVSLRRMLVSKKPIVLSFFAWHCKPCEKGLPMLVKTVGKFGRKNVEVLLVHVGEDKDGEMNKLLERTGAGKLPLVVDSNRAQAGKFGADKTIPRTVVIDTAGVVRAFFLEEGENFESELETKLKEASSES